MRIIFPSLIVAIILSSCSSSLEVIADYDKNADFRAYKTFKFLTWNDANKKLVIEFDRKRIEDAITNEMTARGYKKATGTADLEIGVNIILEQKTNITAYTDYYRNYGYGYDGWGMGYGSLSTARYHQYDYLQGTAIIDVLDTKAKKLLWQGAGIGTVDDNPDKRDKHIPEDIAQIFSKYPIPKPDSN